MISVKNLIKKFGSRTIYDNVNCQLESGHSYAIVGKSGAGKTTFLNMLGGLETPDSGEILVDDTPVNKTTLPKLRKDKFGFIFQNFGLVDNDNVEDNLLIGLANFKLSKSEKQAKMKSALEQVGLAHLDLKQAVHTMSGGEQQRVALARIILKQPSIVFADEPTGSLDGENAQLILDHLLNDFGKDATVLIATHDSRVWEQCDYVIEVKNQNVNIKKNS
ncbi:MAG: ATP-binding cassette domain-containing protein [Lactobacillus sp.]|nr:ATP-binding cassette domain-containing protein [Lactobacillus sp.]